MSELKTIIYRATATHTKYKNGAESIE